MIGRLQRANSYRPGMVAILRMPDGIGGDKLRPYLLLSVHERTPDLCRVMAAVITTKRCLLGRTAPFPAGSDGVARYIGSDIGHYVLTAARRPPVDIILTPEQFADALAHLRTLYQPLLNGV